MMYGKLCAEFYDVDKKFSPSDEIAFYKQFLDKKAFILEPMCGSGRLLIPLMQEGYTVHGVDNSNAMLSSCKERASQFGLHPVLFEDSIEMMSLPHQYNIILIPLGSFQLLYPRDIAFKTLQNIKKHLQTDGKFILDLFVPWDALYENNQEEFNEKEVLIKNGKITYESYNRANKYEQYFYCESQYKKWWMIKL